VGDNEREKGGGGEERERRRRGEERGRRKKEKKVYLIHQGELLAQATNLSHDSPNSPMTIS
jgi:hypothetical protein